MPITPAENRFRSASSTRPTLTSGTRVGHRSGLRSSPNAVNTAHRSTSAARSRSTGKTRGEVERYYNMHSNMDQQNIRLSSAQERRRAENIMARASIEPSTFSPGSNAFSPGHRTAIRLFPESSPRGARSGAASAPTLALAPARAIGIDTVEQDMLHDSIKAMIQIATKKREDSAEVDERTKMVAKAQAEISRLKGERVMHLEGQYAAAVAIADGGEPEYINAMQSGDGKAILPEEFSIHTEMLQNINDDIYEHNLEIANDTEEIQLLSEGMVSDATKFDNLRNTIRNLRTKHNLAQANAGRSTDLVMKLCFHLANDLHDENDREDAKEVLYSLFSMKVDDIVERLAEQEAQDEPFEKERNRNTRRPTSLANATFVQAREEAMNFIAEIFSNEVVAEVKKLSPTNAPAEELVHINQLQPLKIRGTRLLLKHLVEEMAFVNSPAFLAKAQSKSAEEHKADGVPDHVADSVRSVKPIRTGHTSFRSTVDRLMFLLELQTPFDDNGGDDDDDEY